MGGLIVACITLAAACLILLIRYILLNHRIRKLAEQVDGFNSGTADMLDVALEEDRLAQLHNGIADLQLSLARARQLNKGGYWSTAVIITTEQGIHNMGLYANGMDDYRIYLDGEIDTPTEEKLVEQINAIAARSEAAEVVNLLESHRENQQNKQSLLVVFGAITLVFMAVSVSMIVSSNTRRIQSDGRLIGMLRAVGAEERTILDIYTGQVTVSIAGGFVLTVFAFWFMNAIDFLYLDNAPILLGLAAMAVLAVISWVMCRIFLRLRIREIVNKSIIDNIREL